MLDTDVKLPDEKNLLERISDNPQSIEKGSLLWLSVTLVPAGITMLGNKEMLLPALALIILGTLAIFVREFRKLK